MALSSQFSRVDISREAILHNLDVFLKICSQSRVMPVIKSNAYGHGLAEVAQILGQSPQAAQKRIQMVGVNSLPEAEIVHKVWPSAMVMIMGEVEPADYGRLNGMPFTVVVSRIGSVAELLKLAQPPKIHIKIDTGMSRLGLLPADVSAFITQLKGLSNPNGIHGVMTHFANIEDVTQLDYGISQLDKFLDVKKQFLQAGFHNLTFHAASSAAALIFPEARLDMVRIGISLYGVWPSNETRISAAQKLKPLPQFKPAMSWRTRIVHTKTIAPGDLLGYGCTWRASRPTQVAVLPVGYYEGYPRSLSNKSYVVIRGQRAPVIGRVCMNMIMADTTDIPQAALDDEAFLIGGPSGDSSPSQGEVSTSQGEMSQSQGEVVTADYLAGQAGTINYEILTQVNPGLGRNVI